jgi:Tol biopolymer transport system component
VLRFVIEPVCAWACDISDTRDIDCWCIDDVAVLPYPRPLHDVAAGEVLVPRPGFYVPVGQEVHPAVQVWNWGACAESVTVGLRIGTEYAAETSLTVPYGGRITVTTPRTWTPSAGGQYAETLSITDCAFDEKPENDVFASNVVVRDTTWQVSTQYPMGNMPIIQGFGIAATDSGILYARSRGVVGTQCYHLFYRHSNWSGNWDTLPWFQCHTNKNKIRKAEYGGTEYVEWADDTGATWPRVYCVTKDKYPLMYFDIEKGEWNPTSVGNYRHRRGALCWGGGDTIFVQSKEGVYTYSIATDKWSPLKGLGDRFLYLPSSFRRPKKCHDMALMDGCFYFMNKAGEFVSYDLAGDLWCELPRLNTSNSMQVIRMAPDPATGRIYLLTDRWPGFDSCFVAFDVIADTWLTHLPQPDPVSFGANATKVRQGADLARGGRYLFAFNKKAKDMQVFTLSPAEPLGGGFTNLNRKWTALLPSASPPRAPYGNPPQDSGPGPETALDTAAECGPPVLSPDGTRVAYARMDTFGYSQMVVAPRDGNGRLVWLTGQDQADCYSPAWSPDGTWIAYEREDDAGTSVFRVPADSGAALRVSPYGANCEKPAWAPSGALLAYQFLDANEVYQIAVIDSAGDAGGAEQVVLTQQDTLDNVEPGFFPDSDTIYFRKEEDCWQLYKMPATGGSETRLTEAGEDIENVCISPDGAWLFYERADSLGRLQIWRCPTDGSLDEEMLTSGTSDHSWPSAVPDSQHVVFSACDEARSQLCQLDLSTPGYPVSALTEYTTRDRMGSSCSPDGRWVVFLAEDSGRDAGIYKVRRLLGSGLSNYALDTSLFDATADSVAVDFSIEGDASVTLQAKQSGGVVKTLLSSTPLEGGDYTYYWNGRKNSGHLALPGSYWIRIAVTGSGWSDAESLSVQVKGSCVSGNVSGNWTSQSSPYVLTGEVAVASGVTLTVGAGAKVMADSFIGIDVNGALIAKGTTGNRVLFSPYRKLVPVPDPVNAGTWKGIDATGPNPGPACTLDYCVVEYGGYVTSSADHGMVHAHANRVSVTHSVLRGALAAAIDINTDGLDYVQVLDDSFLGNDVGLNEWKVERLEPLTHTCWFAGNTSQVIPVNAGNDVTANSRWYNCGPGVDLVLDNGLSVYPSAGACTLRVMPGVNVVMDEGANLVIGSTNDTKQGVILAEGQPGEGWIDFTGNGWGGIRIAEDDGYQSRFRYCRLSGVRGGTSPIGLNIDGGDAVVQRCSLFDCQDPEDHDAAAIRVDHGRLSVAQTFADGNDIGLDCHSDNPGDITLTTCQFSDNDTGVIVTHIRVPTVQTCNFDGNHKYSVCNRAGSSNVSAPFCWWGSPSGPHGGDTVFRVSYQPVSSTPHTIMPPLDVAAGTVLSRTGWIVGHSPVADTPRVTVSNNYDDTLRLQVRVTMGTFYDQVVSETLAGERADTLTFPSTLIPVGLHQCRLLVTCPCDNRHDNDTFNYEVELRDSVDVAAVAVTAPPDTVTTEDSVAPKALVLNRTDSNRVVPVELSIDSELVETESASVGPHDTVEVEFAGQGLDVGEHEVRFQTKLAGDDNPENDTVSKVVTVLSGDYWRQLESPAANQARLGCDDDFVYSVPRSGALVQWYSRRYGTWGLMPGPRADTVFGLAVTKLGLVALVRPWGGNTFGTGFRAGPVTAENAGSTAPGAGSYTVRYRLCRFLPEHDSWVFFADCDSTLALGNGTGMTSDERNQLYIIEGGTRRLFTYLVSEDSWTVGLAPTVLDYWGALAWSRGMLYCLSDSSRLWKCELAKWEWTEVPEPPGPSSSRYGSALCVDPLTDRLFVFAADQAADYVGTRRFWVRRNDLNSWTRRTALGSDSAGAALCFGPTEAYCSDGRGGFYRYRPAALRDAAAVGVIGPDTVTIDSAYRPAAIVQNNWYDSVCCYVQISAGGHTQAQYVDLPGLTRDTTSSLNLGLLSAGTHTVELVVTLTDDSIRWNDTAYDTVVVRYRRDAEAYSITAPTGSIPYIDTICPAGVVRNNWGDSLDVRVYMAIGSSYQDSIQLTLPPQLLTPVSFDSCVVPVGTHAVNLWVVADDDENPGNDTISGQVEIVDGDFWHYRADGPGAPLRLAGGSGDAVYAARENYTDFRCYEGAADTWDTLSASPLGTTRSVCRLGGYVYAVGTLTSAFGGMSSRVMTGRESNEAAAGLPTVAGTDASAAIVRYDISADDWDTVTMNVPAPVVNGVCLFATSESTIYLLSYAPLTNLRCFDVVHSQWANKALMPGGGPHSYASGAYDGDGTFYCVDCSNGQLYAYNVAQNTWSTLTALNSTMNPVRSALTAQPERNRLFLFWPTTLYAGNTQFYEYDLTEQQWLERATYPEWPVLPALAETDGRVYGSPGSGSHFAQYYPVPARDVAADTILQPPDTVRYDSIPQPEVVIENLGEAPAWCYISFGYEGQGQGIAKEPVYLLAGQCDTVQVNSTETPGPGRQKAELRVSCIGDGNPGNDECSKYVQVEATWEPRAQTVFYGGKLDADTGASVYGADANNPVVARYDVASNQWENLTSLPFTGGCYDLCYNDGRLYALGHAGTDARIRSRYSDAAEKAGATFSIDQVIYECAPGDTSWTLVSDSLPGLPGIPGSNWIVATGDGIFYQSGSNRAFYRYDTTAGWVARESLPAGPGGPPAAAADWDRVDTIFTLVSAVDSFRFYSYSVTADTWSVLAAPPVERGLGVAVAAERGGSGVLAMMPDWYGASRFYKYDRTTGEWTEQTSPPWKTTSSTALTYAGAGIYALTGNGYVTPSWFWCFDPTFAAWTGDFSRDGVAGVRQQMLSYLCQCEPNPFRRDVKICWQVPKLTRVSLKIYSTAGQLVKTLVEGETKPGRYVTAWNGTDRRGRRVASGVYFCALEADKTRLNRKVVLTAGK